MTGVDLHNESSLLVVGWEDTKAASVDSKHNQYWQPDGVHFDNRVRGTFKSVYKKKVARERGRIEDGGKARGELAFLSPLSR